MQHRLKLLYLLPLAFLAITVAAQDSCIDSSLVDISMECPGIEEPVCGCNGITYTNACQAENWHGLASWTAGACPQSCEASFFFSYQSENTALLYNTSMAYDSAEWRFAGETSPATGDGRTLIRTFETDTNYVCLRIWNEEGCEDELCLQIYPGAPEEMCNVTDCVWPGDANGNRRANIYDLLNIGLGFNTAGPQRPFFPDEEDPTAWLPNYCPDWANWAGVVNFKHLDCDGSGLVDEQDVEAIRRNYAPEPNFLSTPVAQAPPVYLEFESTEPIIYDDNTDTIVFYANLLIGNEAYPADGLHGLALQLNYPEELAAQGSIVVEYNNNSFFGPAAEILSLSRAHGNGELGIAFSQKNTNGATGFGPIARLRFIVESDIIDGRPEPETHFEIDVEGVLLYDKNGEVMEYSTKGPAKIALIKDTTAGGNEASRPVGIRLFPNPASSLVQIQLTGIEPEQAVLINSLGQKVWNSSGPGPSLQIDVSGLQDGLYILQLQTEKGIFAKQLVVNR